eukprot:8277774-Pyramimonas_sp.AAC.1
MPQEASVRRHRKRLKETSERHRARTGPRYLQMTLRLPVHGSPGVAPKWAGGGTFCLPTASGEPRGVDSQMKQGLRAY